MEDSKKVAFSLYPPAKALASFSIYLKKTKIDKPEVITSQSTRKGNENIRFKLKK